MTDILLGLILIAIVLAWAERSEWLALRKRRALKLRRKVGKKIKNWRIHRQQRRNDGRHSS